MTCNSTFIIPQRPEQTTLPVCTTRQPHKPVWFMECGTCGELHAFCECYERQADELAGQERYCPDDIYMDVDEDDYWEDKYYGF